MNGMNIKAKIALTIGVLVSMIVLLVALSVANLQILTATEPDSPAAGPGLNRALIWITVIGGICILIGIGMLIKLPASINSPIKQLADGILEIANHNYDVTLNLKGGEELVEVSKNFNRMARRLNEYHNSTLSDLMASKRYMETIINSINEPIIGLDNEMNILFINHEALNVLNLKRENVIRKSAQEIAMSNDLLRRLVRGLIEEGGKVKKEPLKIYADNKESYFQVKYMDITMPGTDGVTMEKRGNVVLLKNITEFQELDTAKTTFISTISHELKTPIALIQGYAEGLMDNINDDEESREFYCDVIIDEAAKMNEMVKKLLNLNQLEFGEDQVNMERFDLNAVIKGVLQSSDILIRQKEAKVLFTGGDPLYVWGDEFKVEEVITNYLTNALNHLDYDHTIEISCKKEGNVVKTTVFNTGDPIPEEDLDKVWVKFFKVDKARTREYGGSGIGLSIVKAIMDSFQQQCGCQNYDNGVAFWFTLEADGKTEEA